MKAYGKYCVFHITLFDAPKFQNFGVIGSIGGKIYLI